MGGKWTVTAWMPDPYREGGYRHEEQYRGPSLWQALKAMWRAKHTLKSGCVTLEWR